MSLGDWRCTIRSLETIFTKGSTDHCSRDSTSSELVSTLPLLIPINPITTRSHLTLAHISYQVWMKTFSFFNLLLPHLSPSYTSFYHTSHFTLHTSPSAPLFFRTNISLSSSLHTSLSLLLFFAQSSRYSSHTLYHNITLSLHSHSYSLSAVPSHQLSHSARGPSP